MKTFCSRGLLAALLVLVALPALATPSTSYYIYDESGHVIGEYDANGNPVQEHIYLGDRPVAVVQGRNGSVGYVTTDQLNTPRAITDSNQNIEWSWNSDPFGNGQPIGSLIYNFRLPGQYYDAETGHNFNNFRDYDSLNGRFIESDPVGLGGGVNTYTYTGDNPATESDPAGTQAIPFPTYAPPPPPPGPSPTVALPPPSVPASIVASTFACLIGICVPPYLIGVVCQEAADHVHACEEKFDQDTETCNAVARAERAGKRPAGAGARCHASASQRFANCLRGQDPGPLDTWNN
jgi:RHS repeat-associated protein